MKSLTYILLIPVALLLGSCTTHQRATISVNQSERLYLYDEKSRVFFECSRFRGPRFDKAPNLPVIPKYLQSNHEAVTDILVNSLEEHRLTIKHERELINQYIADYIESCKR